MITGTLSGIGQLSGLLNRHDGITGTLTEIPIMSGSLTSAAHIIGSLAGLPSITGLISLPAVSGEEYAGPYEFTPNTAEQTVDIQFKTAVRNIVINPIPFNYGLIIWNGSNLTVS